MKPIYEFLLWNNCNNNCQFCFQRDGSRIFTHDQQLLILENAIQFIKSDKFQPGSNVLLVGGEVFDDIYRKQALKTAYSKIIQLMINNHIQDLYINTNLIYDKKCLRVLQDILMMLQNNSLFSRVHFVTSYDPYFRYANINAKHLFLENLQIIHNSFESLKIFVNTILTKNVCRDIIDGSFSISKFQNENKCKVNLIPYIILHDDVAPTKKLLFNAVIHAYKEDRATIDFMMHDLDLKQSRKILQYMHGEWICCECSIDKCGHSVNFKRYSSDDTCFVCDMKILLKSIE